MDAAAVLDDTQAPGRDLVHDPVVEGDDAVRDILFKAVLGDRQVPAFARDNSSHTPVLEPVEEPAQLRPEDRLVGKAGEKGFKGVNGHPFCTDLIDHRAEPDEQAFEVVLAGLLDLGAFNDNVIEDQSLPADKVVKIEPHRPEIFLKIVNILLERDKNAGFFVIGNPPDDELHCKERFPASRATADKRGAAFREPATGNIVKTLDP